MTCRMLTPKIESELGICVFGYVPKIADWHLESRHLGLVLPDEISDLREQMQRLADILEKTLDIESILQMAEGAKEMEDDMPKSLKQLFADPHVQKIRTQRPQIAVAKDEAFCFLYEDNLKLLEELGQRSHSFRRSIMRKCRKTQMDFCCREVIRNCLQQGFPKTAKCLHRSAPVKKSDSDPGRVRRFYVPSSGNAGHGRKDISDGRRDKRSCVPHRKAGKIWIYHTGSERRTGRGKKHMAAGISGACP